MLNKSQMGVKSIIFVLSAGAVFIGFMFSGAFDSLQAYCTYIVSGYYGDDCRDDDPSVQQITHNEVRDWSPSINNSNHIVWSGWDGSDYEIFLYDGNQISQISDNDVDDESPIIVDNGNVFWSSGYTDINFYDGSANTPLGSYFEIYSLVANANGHAAWVAYDEFSDADIYYYNGDTVVNITNGSYPVGSLDINIHDQIVWGAWTGNGSEVYLFDAGSIDQVTTDADLLPNKVDPVISDSSSIVWNACDSSWLSCGFYRYDGNAVSPIVENVESWDYSINALGQFVWSDWTDTDGDLEIYLFDGSTVIQITDNDVSDRYPKLNNSGYITWVSNITPYARDLHEISLYNGQNVYRLTNNYFEEASPVINDTGSIVWYGIDTGDYEIFKSKAWYGLDEYNQAILEERSMWDADGDGKIGLAEAIQALKTAVGGQ